MWGHRDWYLSHIHEKGPGEARRANRAALEMVYNFRVWGKDVYMLIWVA